MSVNVTVTAATEQAARNMAAFSAQSVAGLNAVSAAGKKAAADTDSIGSRILENNRKLKSAIGGLALNASMFAGPQAQQFIYPLILMQKELKGLASAAKIAGMSIPGVGVSILGVSAIIATAVQGVKLYQAQMLELASMKAVQEQFGKSIPNLKKLLDKEKLFGTLDADTVQGLKNQLTDVSTKSPEKQQEVFDNVIAVLKKAQAEDRKAVASVEFDKYLKETSTKFLEGAAKEKEELKKTLDEIVVKGTELATAAGRNPNDLLAVVNPILTQKSAAIDTAELQKQVDAQRRLIEEKRREQMEEDDARLREYDHQQKMLALEQERRQQARIDRIQSDPFTTDAEKYNQLAGAGIPSDQLGADPSSMVQQWRTTFAMLRDEWGTLQQQIARGFFDIVNNGVNLVSDGLTSMIFKTEGWRQKLAQIPQQILQGIVGAIIQMGLRTVASMVLTAIAGKAIAAASTAALIPIAAAQTKIWTTPAALATIASYGGAAAASPFQVTGAVGATASMLAVASAGGGFSEGGYTGAGGKYDPRGIVHAGEVVWSQADVARVGGPRNAELMRQNGGLGGGMASRQEMNIKTVVVADLKQAMQEVLASPYGEQVIVQTLNGRRLDMGFST